MPQAVILAAKRTPIGKFMGGLSKTPSPVLGSYAIKAVLDELPAAKDQVDECIMGCVLQAGLGQNPARQAGLKAGLPTTLNAQTINKVCGSGLQTVILAAQSIKAGDNQLVIAGGFEAGRGWAAAGTAVLLALGFVGLAHALVETTGGRPGRRDRSLAPGLRPVLLLGGVATVILLALAAACGGGIAVNTDYDPQASPRMDAWKAWSWLPDPGGQDTGVDSTLAQLVGLEIESHTGDFLDLSLNHDVEVQVVLCRKPG